MVISGHPAMYVLLAVGLFNSIMFPTIFTLGIRDLGPLTNAGSSILVMAIVGGALMPPVMGRVADATSLHFAFIVPALCYLYIIVFGFWGSKPAGSAAQS